MEEQYRIKLKENGVDIDSVLFRLGGNETVYLLICRKFLKDQSFQLLNDAYKEKNWIEIYQHIHTLKGVALNLGFIRMHFIIKTLLDSLSNDELQNFDQDMAILTNEYLRIISLLEES